MRTLGAKPGEPLIFVLRFGEGRCILSVLADGRRQKAKGKRGSSDIFAEVQSGTELKHRAERAKPSADQPSERALLSQHEASSFG